jgi:hypothetical protein
MKLAEKSDEYSNTFVLSKVYDDVEDIFTNLDLMNKCLDNN